MTDGFIVNQEMTNQLDLMMVTTLEIHILRENIEENFFRITKCSGLSTDHPLSRRIYQLFP